LKVTKTVDWIGSTADTTKTFEICITGPSYPSGNCKTYSYNGGDKTWSNLIPGDYTVTETDPGSQWVVQVTGSPATVPTDGGQATAGVSNTLKPGHVNLTKTVSKAALSGTASYTFQLRRNATLLADGTTLESKTANAANSGSVTFAADLIPGVTYQLCETGLLPGWATTLSTGGFVPNSMLDATTPNPSVDNSIVCHDFTAAANTTTHFDVDNTPPPGGDARTIGYWKNWASCTSSALKKVNSLDRALSTAESSNGGLVVSAGTGTYPSFGATFYLVLHGSTSNPNTAPDCAKAVSLLNKTPFGAKKAASDPAFNMAAQLVAAELNYYAGAGQKAAATSAINAAVKILGKYHFNGTNYQGNISNADKATMNSLANTLDLYNYNLL
jgi:hypothetical protein